jgi:hypothetical protein
LSLACPVRWGSSFSSRQYRTFVIPDRFLFEAH